VQIGWRKVNQRYSDNIGANGDWSAADLTNANLSNSDFQYSNLSNATLNGTNLTKVSFLVG